MATVTTVVVCSKGTGVALVLNYTSFTGSMFKFIMATSMNKSERSVSLGSLSPARAPRRASGMNVDGRCSRRTISHRLCPKRGLERGHARVS